MKMLKIVFVFALTLPALNSLGQETSKTALVEVDAMKLKGVGPVTSVTVDSTIDENLVKYGKRLYSTTCNFCHPTEGEGRGPNLRDITERRSPEWIMNMILATDVMHAQDPLASVTVKKYAKPMPKKDVTEEQARQILEFLRTVREGN